MNMLLTSNTTASAVAAGGVLPLGAAVHGCGRNIILNGSSVSVSGAGYYKIDASASFAVTGTSAATMTLNVDGVPVASASATPSEAGAVVNLSLPWIIRKNCCATSNITLTVDVAGSLQNVILRIYG